MSKKILVLAVAAACQAGLAHAYEQTWKGDMASAMAVVAEAHRSLSPQHKTEEGLSRAVDIKSSQGYPYLVNKRWDSTAPGLTRATYAQPVSQAYPLKLNPGVAAVGGSAGPTNVYGTVSAEMNIDEPSTSAKPSTTPGPTAIPFATGSDRLSPDAKAVIKRIAKIGVGQPITITIQYDKGASVAQSKRRGMALREEFKRVGVSNIRWLDGGEAATSAVFNNMHVQYGPTMEEQLAVRKPGYTESRQVVEQRIIQPVPVQAPAPAGPTAATAWPGTPVQPTSAEQRIDLDMAKADTEYETKMDYIRGVLVQGLMTGAEFDEAKQRAESKRIDTKRRLALEKEQIVNERKAAQLQQAQAEQQKRAQNAALNIRAEQIWEIRETDTTLKDLLARWAGSANMDLAWEVPENYRIKAKAQLTGSLDEVINQVLLSVQSSSMKLQADIYEGSRKIRITARTQGA